MELILYKAIVNTCNCDLSHYRVQLMFSNQKLHLFLNVTNLLVYEQNEELFGFVVVVRGAPIICRSIVYRFIGLLFRYRYRSSTLPAVPI